MEMGEDIRIEMVFDEQIERRLAAPCVFAESFAGTWA